MLGQTLNAHAVDDAHLQIGTDDYNLDSCIAFFFRIDRGGANHPWAGRIYYNNRPIIDVLNPGTPFRRQSFDENMVGMKPSIFISEEF